MNTYLFSIALLIAVGAGFAGADKNSMLISQAEFCLKQARCALPYFRNSRDFSTLTAEINTLQGLVDRLKSGSEDVAQLTGQLLQHERTLTMLLFKLKHMHPIPIGNPDEGGNPGNHGNPWGKKPGDDGDN